MTCYRRPGPLGVGDDQPTWAPPIVSRLPAIRESIQSGSIDISDYRDPSFLDALGDSDFWLGYGESLMEVGKSAGYLIVGEVSVYSGWMLSKLPGGAIAGRYLMVDGASTYLGAMCNVSRVFHGAAVQCVADDFLGEAYRSAAEFYTGDRFNGDLARATLSVGSVFRAGSIQALSPSYNLGRNTSPPLLYMAPETVTVSRWGREGLEAGDWVMKGGQNWWTYARSAKWQPGLGNQFAPYGTGAAYQVPLRAIKWPDGIGVDGAWKGIFGQRIYTP